MGRQGADRGERCNSARAYGSNQRAGESCDPSGRGLECLFLYAQGTAGIDPEYAAAALPGLPAASARRYGGRAVRPA
ncbi:hypothetical protein D3C76_1365590 [compost metagenome]